MISDELPPMEGVATALILLYAQPIRRLVRLTIREVQHEADQVALRLGDPPTPVPEPFTGILLNYIHTARPNRPNSTAPASG
ncbi:hypothetical protein ACFV6D_22070 [Kitasatospora sp. NPDC059812]|uniref:hypothetical protein n=1 Tax=Kitasatospora sp. NPDC059812 TaxID=3346958 RepID=UPI003657ACD8